MAQKKNSVYSHDLGPSHVYKVMTLVNSTFMLKGPGLALLHQCKSRLVFPHIYVGLTESTS